MDHCLLKADLIALCETWYPKQNFQAPELEGYQGHHIMSGQGKGVSIFVRETLLLLSSPIKFNHDHLQIIKLDLEKFTVLLVYRSPSYNSHSLLMENLLKLAPSRGPVLILGDFNIFPVENNNHYKRFIPATCWTLAWSPCFEIRIEWISNSISYSLDTMPSVTVLCCYFQRRAINFVY